MKIGLISTRLAGTDGVSLETHKMAHVLRTLGHETVYCAGELDNPEEGLLVPELHFNDPVALALGELAFGSPPAQAGQDDTAVLDQIATRAAFLLPHVRRFVHEYQLDALIAQNVFAIPMQLPLAQALTQVLAETELPALAHNHDFYWERERFAVNRIPNFLANHFPPILPHLRHAVINTAAQKDLYQRRGVASTMLPNVFDFASPAPGIDDYNADFRQAIGLTTDDWLILQPTRVVPRKGIELAIDLLARLNNPRAKLVITHKAGDEGLQYLQALQHQAKEMGVDLRYVADVVDDVRGRTADGRKIYSLWDTYPHADFVTYPSLYEGFGNALLETVYFRLPALVNQYHVYVDDIAPHGFQFVEIERRVTDETVTAVGEILANPETAVEMTNRNYELALTHFSYETLEKILADLGF
jgi:glycosyltransferase involved in cell wall biosynthesis